RSGSGSAPVGAPSDATIRRRHLRRGTVCVTIGALLLVALLIGWIVAGGDPTARVSGRGYGLPLWASSLWIGLCAVGLIAFGVSQWRVTALFRASTTEQDRSE
ncbi:MAG: hypothetical protein ACTJHU_09790, partial [Mycetocola sp.]